MLDSYYTYGNNEGAVAPVVQVLGVYGILPRCAHRTSHASLDILDSSEGRGVVIYGESAEDMLVVLPPHAPARCESASQAHRGVQFPLTSAGDSLQTCVAGVLLAL